MHVPFADLNRMHAPLREGIEAAIRRVIDTNGYIMGPEVTAFEKEFAAFCTSPHAVALSSGTEALVLSLLALGVGAGDEVITVPNTFIATSEAISTTGATVRFVDVDPRTYTMDPNRLEAALTPKSRAVIPVHLYGQPADMEAILDIARRHGLFVIEDAAQAHGARWSGQPMGSFGHCTCFSFYPGKNLGAMGDAGAVVTQDDDLALRLAELRDHGRARGAKYEHAREGVNARMDAMQAAILRVKLVQLAAWNSSRQRAAARYGQLLRGCDGITLPFVAPQAEHVYHLYVVQTERRDALQAFLKQQGVATGIHSPIPLHRQPAYAHLELAAGSFPVAEAQAERSLSLPMFAAMRDDEIAYVADKIREFQTTPVHV